MTLCLVFLIEGSLSVCADMIWEPTNTFYSNHKNECTYVGRVFTANGSDGTVTVRETPDSDAEVATVQNGSTFTVTFTFKDSSGNDWGLVEFVIDGSGKPHSSSQQGDKIGWIPMKDLTVVYDEISFRNDHKSEFETYKGDLDSYVIKKEILVWTYPDSGNISSTIKTLDAGKLSLSDTYTDKDGRLWGYLAYYRMTKGWICISNPEGNTPTSAVTTAAAINVSSNAETSSTVGPNSTAENTVSTAANERLNPSDSSDIVESITPVQPSDTPAQPGNAAVTVLLIILVTAAAAATAVMIRIFWNKQKDTNHSDSESK